MQNDHIGHGNTYGKGRVLGSAMPLHLHKCVAQFVNSATAEFLVFVNDKVSSFSVQQIW